MVCEAIIISVYVLITFQLEKQMPSVLLNLAMQILPILIVWILQFLVKKTLHSADTIQSSNNVNAHVTQTFDISGLWIKGIILQTAIVSILSLDGQTLIEAWVLLDSPSQRTFMINNLTEQLKLLPQHCQYQHNDKQFPKC